MGWMVIIGHRSSKNTYSANKMRDNSRYHWDTLQRRPKGVTWMIGMFCNSSRKSNQMPSQRYFLYSQYDRCFTLQHIKCVLNNPVSHSHWSKSRSYRLRPCGPFTFSASLAFLQVFTHQWSTLTGRVNLFLSWEREMLLAEDSRTLIITPTPSKLLAMTTAFTLIKLWS